MSKRFCEQCGAALLPDAHFCEACGAAVDVGPAATSSPPPIVHAAAGYAPSPVPQRFATPPPLFAAAALPVRRSASGAGLALAVLASIMLLSGGIGLWLYGPWNQHRGVEQSAPEAIPAEAGGDRTAGDQLLPPIPVTDDPVDLDRLRAAVEAANARDIDALYAASPGSRGPETREALDVAIRALAKGLYRHQVVDGHGDLDTARAELRAFLSGLEHKGLGLSEDAVEAGVVHVGP